MNWNQLLSTKRVKALWGEKSSTISEGDPRSEFDRDYGRAIFSTPVRRLQDKAQVFPLEEHDAIRTRLTHSLEVSSIARSLSERLARWLLQSRYLTSYEEDVSSVVTIAATCGLIHDIGNPPFGHAGEVAIRTWFQRKLDDPKETDFFHAATDSQYAQDFLLFEGNAQTLRLLSRLQ